MIYKSWDNELYFVENFLVTSLSEKDSSNIINNDFFTTAFDFFTGEEYKVNLITYKLGGQVLTLYAVDGDLAGKHVFYKDIYGQYMLMEAEKFNEKVPVVEVDGIIFNATQDDPEDEVYLTPRFEKINDEHLFDLIAEKISNVENLLWQDYREM